MTDIVYWLGFASGIIITLAIEFGVLAGMLVITHICERRTKRMAVTAKEYLQQYREAVNRANAAIHHREELRAMAERITPNYNGIGGGNHAAGDALGETVAKLMDAEARVDAEIEMLIATEREITAVINSVQNPTYQTLLVERYINGKTWEQIAVNMNYNYRWVLRLHGRALVAVKQAIESHT